jgi:hypothetical protein
VNLAHHAGEELVLSALTWAMPIGAVAVAVLTAKAAAGKARLGAMARWLRRR